MNAHAAMGNIPQLNSLGQLTSILESINPFINGQMQYQQQHQPHGIDPQQMMGNAAGLGGTFFTPIVNHPEVAILGVSRMEWKPVWRDGEFVPRLILPLSLSYDHRVIDGADAVRFTTRLKTILSDIRNLIL